MGIPIGGIPLRRGPGARGKVQGWDPFWNHCPDATKVRIHTYMSNPQDQPNVPADLELLRRMEELEDRFADLEDAVYWDEDPEPAEESTLRVHTLHCQTLCVGDGSCLTPIGIQQKHGESFICLPGGTGGGMVFIGGEANGACFLMGTDPQGAPRWALGFDPATGCVFPREDLRLLGEDGPMWQIQQEMRQAVAGSMDRRALDLGMAGLTG